MCDDPRHTFVRHVEFWQNSAIKLTSTGQLNSIAPSTSSSNFSCIFTTNATGVCTHFRWIQLVHSVNHCLCCSDLPPPPPELTVDVPPSKRFRRPPQRGSPVTCTSPTPSAAVRDPTGAYKSGSAVACANRHHRRPAAACGRQIAFADGAQGAPAAAQAIRGGRSDLFFAEYEVEDVVFKSAVWPDVGTDDFRF